MPYNDISKPAPPIPSPEHTVVLPGVTLLRPLSRRGEGPGIIILTENYGERSLAIEDGVPAPLVKWAEEGYTVVEIHQDALMDGNANNAIKLAIEALTHCEKCEPKDKIGLVGRSSPPLSPARKQADENMQRMSLVLGAMWPNTLPAIRLSWQPPCMPPQAKPLPFLRECQYQGYTTLLERDLLHRSKLVPRRNSSIPTSPRTNSVIRSTLTSTTTPRISLTLAT